MCDELCLKILHGLPSQVTTLSCQLIFSFRASRKAPLVHNSITIITWRAKRGERLPR